MERDNGVGSERGRRRRRWARKDGEGRRGQWRSVAKEVSCVSEGVTHNTHRQPKM